MAKATVHRADLERYIDHLRDFGWAPCPACGAEQEQRVTKDRPVVEEGTVYVVVECPACGSSWTIAYQADHILEHLVHGPRNACVI